MKHISKDILFVGMLFAAVMMAAQPAHAQGSLSPRMRLAAQLNEAEKDVAQIRTQLAAVDEQITDESATVAQLAAAVKSGTNPKKIAILLDQSERRADGIDKTISSISNSVDVVRMTLQEVAAEARAAGLKKIFTEAQRMLDEVDSLVSRLEQSKQDLDDVHASIQEVRGQLGTVT